MNPFSLVFPGQGSQKVGMVADYAAVNPAVRVLFEEASDRLGYDLWEIVTEDSQGLLDKTEYTQPALLAAGVAAWKTWQATSDQLPCVLAGHSLGEYTALVCAEAMSFSDAIHLVSSRGRFMQEAVAEGEGAMAAIVGLSDEDVVEICKHASDLGPVSPANYNSTGQVVIAGVTEAVAKAEALAKEKGAKLAVRLPVSVPSHCVLMKPAAEKLEELLSGISLKEPKIDVVNNVHVEKESDPEEIKSALIEQLYSPVRWVQTMAVMRVHVSIVGECGPGKVLSGLAKRIDKSIVAKPLNNLEQMQAFANLLIAE